MTEARTTRTSTRTTLRGRVAKFAQSTANFIDEYHRLRTEAQKRYPNLMD